MFPGIPQERTQTLHGQTGEMEAHAFIVTADTQTGYTDRQTGYTVTYGDIAKNVDFKNPQGIFDRSQTLETGENGKIVFQQEIKLGDYPGREFEFVAGGKANYSGRIRVFLVERRLYVIATVFQTANPHPQDRDIFFKSFSLQKN